MTTTASHMMKTTRRGRPFLKDTHDLFATLMITLPLETHRQFFKSYPNSFVTDDACNNLASLKFSQSNRGPDPKETSRIITTTTTTTFSMTRDMAKGICQHFMDAHLIENAADLESTTFKDRGVYMLTGKGLHVLERFVAKNGVASDHLLHLYATQNIIQKILHLERRSQDDELLITKGVIETVFKRFAGSQPNITHLSDDDLTAQLHSRPHTKPIPLPPGESIDRAGGILVRKVPSTVSNDKKSAAPDEYHFSALSACDWLLDYATIVGLDEAAELAGQFVRYGLISLVSDKGRVKDNNIVVLVKAGGPGGGLGAIMQEAEFRATEKAVYKMTKEGIQVAEWNRKVGSNPAATASKPNLRAQNSNASTTTSRSSHSDDQAMGTIRNPTFSEVSDRHRGDHVDIDTVHALNEHGTKDSHTAKLKQILEDTALRSVFREFLRSNFCEENLNFWLEVQEFKRKFTTTSSAVATPNAGGKNLKSTGLAAMERHQQDLINQAFVIYNTYLAPASPSELNIDHNLRAELISYMNQISSDKDAGLKGTLEPGVGNTLHANQLQTLVKLYERIQGYIFRLMATDSVPKFSKTERFLNLMRSVHEYNEHDANLASQTADLSLKEKSEDRQASPTRAYLTISQAASEKQAALGKPQQLA